MTENFEDRENKKAKNQILVLAGSPHANGFTARFLKAFLEPLKSDAQVTVVNAFRAGIAPCNGCDFCSTAPRCAMRDFDEIDALIRQSGLIVVATPVYYLSFPAPLKAIIDRMQQYFSARFSLGITPPIEKHRLAAVLVTAGSSDLDGAEIISRQLKMAFSVMNTSLEGVAVWGNTDLEKGDGISAQAQESARNLALAIKSKL